MSKVKPWRRSPLKKEQQNDNSDPSRDSTWTDASNGSRDKGDLSCLCLEQIEKLGFGAASARTSLRRQVGTSEGQVRWPRPCPPRLHRSMGTRKGLVPADLCTRKARNCTQVAHKQSRYSPCPSCYCPKNWLFVEVTESREVCFDVRLIK